MSDIIINYDEVYRKTNELKNKLNNDVLRTAENEYKQIQNMLNSLDGAANEKLKQVMKLNQEKTVIVAKTLEKLLKFMANSSKQFQQHDKNLTEKVNAIK